MAPSLTHLALQVRSVAESTRFFEEYCKLHLVHDRTTEDGSRVVWLAEKGRETEFVFVLISGGTPRLQADDDYGHLGFALESRAAVDTIADRARTEGCLVWPPRQEPWPVGYYCGVRDPDGRFVEFSYGQPLGPGSEPPT